MRVHGAAAFVAGLSVFAAASSADAQSMARKLDLLRLQDQATAATTAVLETDGRACAAQSATFKTVFGDPRFDRMEEDVRRLFLFALMLCSEVKDPAMAVAAAGRLEPIAKESAEIGAVYSIRISDSLQRGATAEAARQFLELADRRPAVAASWGPEMLASISDEIPGEPDLSRKVLQRLIGLDWTNLASRRAAHNDWALAYGRLLADRGDSAGAGKAMAKADELYALLMVAGDRRFASIWPAFQREGRFDWTAAAERALATARKDMDASPTLLRPARDALGALRALGRYDEAMLIGQAFRARLQDGDAFDDRDSQSDQVLLALAQTLFETGDAKQAEAIFIEAMGDQPSRAIDASMAWAGRLIDLGRAKEALALLDAVDRDYLTPYGVSWLDAQRACAQAGLDPKAAETTVAGLRTTRDENPGALSQGLLCLNKTDEAADLLAWRLRSSAHRAGGLDPYWITRAPPHVTPRRAEFERRRQAMLASPQARQALDAVGRPVEAPLTGDYWGGF